MTNEIETQAARRDLNAILHDREKLVADLNRIERLVAYAIERGLDHEQLLAARAIANEGIEHYDQATRAAQAWIANHRRHTEPPETP